MGINEERNKGKQFGKRSSKEGRKEKIGNGTSGKESSGNETCLFCCWVFYFFLEEKGNKDKGKEERERDLSFG